MRTILMLAVCAAAMIAADKPAEKPVEKKVLPWEKNHIAVGQSLYRANCIVCHDIDQAESKKYGPSFYHLYKIGKMPISGGAPNRDYFAIRIKFGGELMPAFGDKLSDAEIATILDYIQTR